MGRPDGERYAFLAMYGSATLRFDALPDEVDGIVTDFEAHDTGTREERRSSLREIVRTGFLDGAHMDPARSQVIASAVVYLCMTSATREVNPAARGFMIFISRLPDGGFNFRFAACDPEMVEEQTAKARKGLKYVVTVTPEQAAKAVARKRTPPPRDPSLEPPPKPRPERWLPALEAAEKALGKPAMGITRKCLEEGAMFVWKSRQIAEAAQEEIDASLEAMAQYDRLHLPFSLVWAETRDWLEVPRHDAPAERVPARFAIAASEQGGTITFWGFADVEDRMTLSLLSGTVDQALLSGGHRHFAFKSPDGAAGTPGWDEAAHRQIARACGERLLELLFLLSTQGVAKEKVRDGGGRPGKRPKAQRRMSARDYTIVRVPMRYVQDGAPGEEGRVGSTGRWVRAHVRRAHQWGVNTRPLEQQRWVEACLVGAARNEGPDGEVTRPSYRVA